MNTLFEKSIRTLELPVVLEMLASLAVSDTAKEKCRGLMPVCELEEAARLQQEDYQKTLAAVIAAGYLRWMAGEDRK